ncbi:hypothetical protein GMLC_20790 [Geomonas limicola]|uniref:Capsule polysaccharide biosynthesis protein n=1 Tax=Geomonas limicola TaxID=2740186 RepID=A0A6V8N7Y4_9BACT|nr:hypothetical protein [Geomonas limicola]GFO68500.1 hypothetical protein GMLC_20790 [Geomonas limicola]
MDRILFFVPFGSYAVHNQLDAIFATRFRQAGLDPAVVRCDGLYRHCDILAWSGERSAEDCRGCQEAGERFFDAFGLPRLQMSGYLTPQDHQAAEAWAAGLDPADYLNARYGELPVGYWVISSIFSYFRITDKGLVLPQVREVHRSFLKSALLTYWALKRLMTEQQPRAVFIFNTRFTPYRVAYEVTRELRIEEITHERGCFDDSFVLYNNRTCLDTEPIFEIYDAWREVRLSREQLGAALGYLRNREQGRDLNYPAFSDVRNEFHTIRHTLRIPEGARVLAVFTSGESEGAYCGGYSEVTTQFDRIDTLIELYRKRSDYLVIRHHPHMAGNAQEPPENYYLTRAYQQAWKAPANVRVVMPHEALSSYALLRNVDGVISYFSSVGYEAAGRGVAAAALPQCPFSRAMRHEVPDRPEEVAALIDRLYEQTDALDAADLVRSFRFVYAYIYRLSLQFRSFGIKDNYQMDLRIQSLDELSRGVDPELDRVCRSVLENTPINRGPGPADPVYPAEEEQEFVAGYQAELARERQWVRARSRVWAASRLAPAVAVLEPERPGGAQRSPFPSWQERSRHTRLTRYPFAGSAAPGRLPEALAPLVAGLEEQYVLIAPPEVYHDEAFLSGALDQLLADPRLELDGVRSGIWTLTPEGVVDQEFWTKRTPTPDLDTLLAANAGFADPLALCATVLFRRDALARLLERIATLPPQSLSAGLLAHLDDERSFRQPLIPLALISHNG